MKRNASMIALILVFAVLLVGSIFLYRSLSDKVIPATPKQTAAPAPSAAPAPTAAPATPAPTVAPTPVQQQVDTAPDICITDRDGNDVLLSDFFGKPIVVNFWASWCGPCMQEMPHMVQLYQLYHTKGLGILGVSLDTDAEKWKNAVKQTGASWTQISELKKNSEIAQMFGIEAIPFTLIVDKKGNVLAGGLTGTELEDFIHGQLGE